MVFLLDGISVSYLCEEETKFGERPLRVAIHITSNYVKMCSLPHHGLFNALACRKTVERRRRLWISYYYGMIFHGLSPTAISIPTHPPPLNAACRLPG